MPVHIFIMSDCNRDLSKFFAETVRSWTIYFRGVNDTDKYNLAEMSLQNSIVEISTVENKAKLELQQLVNKVKTLDPVRQKVSLHEVLRRSRVLRGTLSNTQKKRLGMEQHLETLRQSQLNQTMMTSMKQTTDALQTLGMNITNAEDIMFDLEESSSDLKDIQSTLSQSIGDVDFSADDLDAELEMMLSDDALCPLALSSSVPSTQKATLLPMPTPAQSVSISNSRKDDPPPPDAALEKVQQIERVASNNSNNSNQEDDLDQTEKRVEVLA